MLKANIKAALSTEWARRGVRAFATLATVAMAVVTWGPLLRWLNYPSTPRRAAISEAQLGEWVEIHDIHLECSEGRNVEGPTRLVLAFQGRHPFLLGSYGFRCADAPPVLVGTMERLPAPVVELLGKEAPGLLRVGGDRYFCASCGPEDDAGSVLAGGLLVAVSVALATFLTGPRMWRRWT